MKDFDIKKRLIEEAEVDYKKFSASLIPNINNVLGIRLPILRQIAKEIYNKYDWQFFLNFSDCKFMEEYLLKAMVISKLNYEPEKMLKFVEYFIPQIDNWSVCDCFCSGLKFTKKNQELVWQFLSNYFSSENEFEIRFVSVMLLDYFVDEKYIDKTLNVLSEIYNEGYYAKMGIAWAYSVCFVKFFDKTLKHFKTAKIDDWIFKKSIQKSCESLRLDKSSKEILKRLKIEA